MRILKYLAVALILLSHSVFAENILMVRSHQNFNDTMAAAKLAIEEYGYTIAHIQLCDGGLHEFGYKTDGYNVIFFGKLEEVQRIASENPEMVPFMPLKLAVIAEKDETIVSILNPLELEKYLGSRNLHVQFKRWESDIRAILDELRQL